jgi:hypothetical protein
MARPMPKQPCRLARRSNGCRGVPVLRCGRLTVQAPSDRSAFTSGRTGSQALVPGSVMPTIQINSESLHLLGIDTALCTVLDQSSFHCSWILLKAPSAIEFQGSSAVRPRALAAERHASRLILRGGCLGRHSPPHGRADPQAGEHRPARTGREGCPAAPAAAAREYRTCLKVARFSGLTRRTFTVTRFAKPPERGLPLKRRHQIVAVLSCTSAVEMSGSLTGRVDLQPFRWIS